MLQLHITLILSYDPEQGKKEFYHNLPCSKQMWNILFTKEGCQQMRKHLEETI